MSRPPRLAQWLLSQRIWPDERAIVLGDLEEQFQTQVRTTGAVRAVFWYWREAAQLTWGLWWWMPRAPRQRGTVMAMDDVRYAVRRLRKQPLTSAVSVATLACAIGAAAATWSLVSVVLLHPLQVPEPERLVQIGSRYATPRGPRTSASHTYPSFVALRDAGVMTIAAWGSINAPTPLLVEAAGPARERRVTFASHDYLDVLGLRPSLGRFFTEAEDRRGGPLVAVLSDRFWREEFGSDPAVIGRVIRLRDRTVDIIGVAPRGFRGLNVAGAPALFMPLHTIDQIQGYEGLFGDRPPANWVRIVGRLSDGVTPAQMQARLSGLRIDPRGQGTVVLTDASSAVISESSRADVREFSRLLASTVALLVAIGSLTVGMLLVMRIDARDGEFAMCRALGASRARLVAGVAIEGVVLAACGAALALPVSRMLFAGLQAFDLPGGISVDQLDLSLDSRVIAATAAAAVVSVLLMGAVASMFGLRRDLGDVLRSHSGVTPRLMRRRSRSFLVTAQVAVTLVLVTGAGLFARSVTRALSLNPTLDTSQLLSGPLKLDAYGYDPLRAAAFVDELKTRLARHPAIAFLGFSQTPSAIASGGTIRVDGEPHELRETMYFTGIDDGYLRMIGLPISAGRTFDGRDRAGAPPVAIVSASLARLIAGRGSPLGRRIEWSGQRGEPANAIEIVGVVPDVVTSLSSLEPLRVYQPIAQQVVSDRGQGVSQGYQLIVRATGDAAAAADAITTAIRTLDPAFRPEPMTTIDASMLEQMGPQRFGMAVMGVLGAVALFLSLLGMYVLAESMATLRRREMGIRTALGASRRHVRTVLLSDTLRVVGTGLLLGFGLSWLGAGTIRAFLFRVEPFDPIVTGGVAAAIIALTLAVSLRPAVSSARLDLARVLRQN